MYFRQQRADSIPAKIVSPFDQIGREQGTHLDAQLFCRNLFQHNHKVLSNLGMIIQKGKLGLDHHVPAPPGPNAPFVYQQPPPAPLMCSNYSHLIANQQPHLSLQGMVDMGEPVITISVPLVLVLRLQSHHPPTILEVTGVMVMLQQTLHYLLSGLSEFPDLPQHQGVPRFDPYQTTVYITYGQPCKQVAPSSSASDI